MKDFFFAREQHVCQQIGEKKTQLFQTTWTPSISRHFLHLILYGVLAVVFDIMPLYSFTN